MAALERNLWSLITTPLDDIRSLMDVCGIMTIGQLCELSESELAQLVSPEGLMGIKRDLAYKGLSLSPDSVKGES